MESRLGKGQINLLTWLTNNWLTSEKSVCFLEGFSGIGKTTIARELESQIKTPYQVIRVDMPEAEADPVGDLLLELATSLHELGRNEIADALEGGREKANAKLVDVFRNSTIIIIIDEFQRAFRGDEGRPVADVEKLIERMGRRTTNQGRMLLLTNRRVAREKWSEAYEIRTLPGLSPEEAEQLLESQLENEGQGDDVPAERRRDVVNWLGRNPRAIRVLAGALAEDPLDYLISLNPESWEARDRETSPTLLRSLEEQLLERSLEKLNPGSTSFLNQLAVYRKEFKREAMQTLTTNVQDVDVMKSELISRFFMEQHKGWFSLHEIVREIALQKLRETPSLFRQAHTKAGEYYSRHFKAKSIIARASLGAHFVEARYHLVQAQREQELNGIVQRFGNFLKATFSENAPVPLQPNELDERIAVLSALLATPGPKSLEHYLARLLKRRGKTADIKRALEHSRVATDSRDASEHRWLLRIELEELIYGVAKAINEARQGISQVPREQRTAVYVRCAELLGKDNRIEEAIALLKDGVNKISPNRNLSALYQICAELLAENNRMDEAIALLEDGMGKNLPDQSLTELRQLCAELLAKDNRIEEAIALLKDGIGKNLSDQSLTELRRLCAELLAKDNRIEEAIALLKDGINKVSSEQPLAALHQSCAELLVKDNRMDEAIALLKDGINKIPPSHNLFTLYQSGSSLLSRDNRIEEAIKLLREGIRSMRDADEKRHQLVIAAIYLYAQKRDAANLESFLKGTGKDAIDPQQLWLGGTILLQIKQEWEHAAEYARRGRREFPANLSLVNQEAFSWLCANQPEAAELALSNDLPSQKSGHTLSWLAAFVALRNGKPADARNYLAAFLDRPIADDEEVSEAWLIRLWDTPIAPFAGTNPTYRFPTLPPSLTGLPELVTRQQHSPPVLPNFLPQTKPPMTTAAPIAKNPRKAVLVVATEWESKYGGLSTFNRDLCKAISRAGHKVCCLVPRATPEELSAAKDAGVELVIATPAEEATESALLFRRPILPADFDPQIIIGHDRITGASAQAQATDFFPKSKFVLVIHTAPGEIEWYKPRAEGENTAAETAEQREKAQRQLASRAGLVVSVGPRLKREVEANLVGLKVPIIQFDPGLGERKQPEGVLESIYCLLLGRAEDESLKGLDIAARALGKLLQKNSGSFPVEPELIIRGAVSKTGDDLREKLIRISGTGLNVRVKEYTSQFERITEDIQRASLLLMPSRKEGFGLVGLEAITLGIPILISSNSGLAELLKKKLPPEITTRCVIPVTNDLEIDSQVWAEAIEQILLDREVAFAHAIELQTLFARLFSWEQSIDELFHTLAEIAE